MNLQVPFSMIIVSKRNSGKSYLCKHLLKTFMDDTKLFDWGEQCLYYKGTPGDS